MKDEEKVEARDSVAFMLLKDFILSGFPSADMEVQVNLAYSYADLVMKRRRNKPEDDDETF